jgi:hypothetical protein
LFPPLEVRRALPTEGRLKGTAKTIAKRALAARALADIERWITGDRFTAAA